MFQWNENSQYHLLWLLQSFIVDNCTCQNSKVNDCKTGKRMVTCSTRNYYLALVRLNWPIRQPQTLYSRWLWIGLWRLSPFHTTGYCHWRCLWSISGTYRILHIVEPHTNNQTLHYARIPAYLTWWIWILFFVKCVPKYSCLLHIYFTTTVLSSNSSPNRFYSLAGSKFSPLLRGISV